MKLHGFRILERNWVCRYGEIDLIAKRGREIRFIEVKYRTTSEFGYPEESVTETKLEHIRNAAERYLQNLDPRPKYYQIDVLAIRGNGQNKPEIHWIQQI